MDYDFLPVSNGSGDAATMTVTNDRLSGSTTLKVSSVANLPTKFIGTYGTLGSNNIITPSSKRDFKGHISGSDIIIDAFEPGSVDNGNTAGQVVLIKPNTGWSNRVAKFIKDITGFGTPPDIIVDDLIANTITVGGKDISQLLPAGVTAPFAGAVVPTGWLLCDGSAVSRATYAALFSSIGVAFGAGNGSSTFNLPDAKGRTIHGVDAAQAEFTPRGFAGGSKDIMAHSHGVSDPGHNHSMNGAGGHNHSIGTLGSSGSYGIKDGPASSSGTGFTSGVGDHTHFINGSGTGLSVNSAGSASNNLVPYLVMPYIIKT